MTSEAIASIGAVLKLGDGASSEVFTQIAGELRSIDGPQEAVDTYETTHLLSPGSTKEFLGGWIDPGSYDLELNWTRDGYSQFSALKAAGVIRNWQVVMPDTSETTYEFSALVTSLGRTVPRAGEITFTATIKVSGPETMAS